MPPKKTTTTTTAAKKPATTTAAKKPASTTTVKKTTTTGTKKTTGTTKSTSNTKKTDTKKTETKKKEEEKEQEQQQQQQEKQKEEEEQKKEDVIGSAQVKYNTYDKSFSTLNGEMKWTDIDEEYCISYVFEGQFQKHLVKIGTEGYLEQKDFPTDKFDDDGKPVTETIFYGVEDKQNYELKIIEDEEAESKREHVGYKAPEKKEEEKRGEGCSCLFGNPCQDKYVCQDWNNREEVARKNGWKGFS